MKKIYLTLTVAAAALFTSCDMDLAPIGTIDDSKAIETVTDLMKARNGIYEGLRGICTGGAVYYTDIQMDQFIGLTINGNQNGDFSHGSILSNNGSIQGMWASCYSNIADANYLLGHTEQVLENPELTEEEILEAKRYIAETKFARAYYYYYLFDHFCESYTAAKAEEPAKGLPLVTVFNPTGDLAAYPGRSTMAETFALIDKDLEEAYDGLKAYEEGAEYEIIPMAPYVNSYVVLAFQARLALLRQDWKTAVEKANLVIDSGIYTLANTTNYAKMWSDDESTELIFRPISTNTELGIGSIGGAYIDGNPELAYYLPSNTTLNLTYTNRTNDVRWGAFFKTRRLNANGTTYAAYAFNKYPGNTNLYTGTSNNLMNMGKPFRLSETYLILAEAACEDGDIETANDALNTLRKNRIKKYKDETYESANELRQHIRNERTTELLGEGFRMSDLRRWGLGFSRDGSYPLNSIVSEIFVKIDTEVTYEVNDHRYVWPIPNREMENNPQLKGQQNLGY